MNTEYLDKLHSELLGIMDDIDKLCQDNNICYYLVGGTLLGAVRHKGFIPWDDDLDIAMPREDMLTFLKLARERLDANKYEVIWSDTDSSCWNSFPKVCLKGTLFEEDKQEWEKTGIFIDIFPLDLSPAYNNALERRKKVSKRINGLIKAKNSDKRNKKKIFQKIISCFFSASFLLKCRNWLFVSVQKKGNSHYANFGSQYSLKKQTMPVEWYGEGVRVPFEDRYYMVPTNYIKILKSIYGENYMTLPPIEKRRCHYPSKVIFSDGTSMEFERPKHMVTISEQENY